MIDATSDKATRELDGRTHDGLDVRLLWNSLTNQVVVAVHDARSGDSFELHVPAGDAVFAFHHPYAYANCPPSTDSLVV